MAAGDKNAGPTTRADQARTLFGIPIGLAVALAIFGATIVAMVIAVAVLRAPGA